MAKVISYTKEDEITMLTDPEIEYVSLVSHAANRMPFKILKEEVKDMSNKKTFYSVLAPKDVEQEKLDEVAKEYELSLETKGEDELESYEIYKQIEDEKVDQDSRQLVALDKDNHIYGVVAELKEESEEEGTEKADISFETMDDLADGLMATADVVMGALRQPQATVANRKNTVLNALDNFRKYAESVLSNSKAEDIAEVKEMKAEVENLKDLFQEKEEDSEKNEQGETPEDVLKQFTDSLDVFKQTVYQKIEEKADEKAKEKIEAFKSEDYESMKAELNQNLEARFEDVATKEDLDEKINEVKEQVEELANTTKGRKSEVDETAETNKQEKTKKQGNKGFVTLA